MNQFSAASKNSPILSLGTAQFGFDYGVTNSEGQVSTQEVKNILKCSIKLSINSIDTARLYGTSEESLGKNDLSEFEITTKFSLRGPGDPNLSIQSCVTQSLEISLLKLGCEKIYGFLVHDVNEFFTHTEEILETATVLKSAGKIQKFGVSIYSPEQAEQVLKVFVPDIIQFPLNIFDQRFLTSGLIDEFYKNNVEIQTRSAFLQGILLQEFPSLDSFFSFAFSHFRKLDQFVAEHSLNRMEACLKFLVDQPKISKIIVGACSALQLEEINKALKKVSNTSPIEFQSFSTHDPRLINPLSWPMLKK